jgi:hypothetical protein
VKEVGHHSKMLIGVKKMNSTEKPAKLKEKPKFVLSLSISPEVLESALD